MGMSKTIKEGVSASFGQTDNGPMVSWSTWKRPLEVKHFGTIEEAENFFNDKVKELEQHPARPLDPQHIRDRIMCEQRQIPVLQALADKSSYERKDFYDKAIREAEAHIEILNGMLKQKG